jgi:threonine dehydratase
LILFIKMIVNPAEIRQIKQRKRLFMTLPALTLDMIHAAAERLKGHILFSRCCHSRTLSSMTGSQLWIKYENEQFTASFKERGALNKLLTLTEAERKKGVIAASAGNHAQGVAYHAGRLHIPSVIVMPSTTPLTKIEQTRYHGAEVILEGDTFDEAYAHACLLSDQRGLTFVHPFDDLEVIAGQGTIALEMLQQVPDLEVLVVPIGGGGLISGIAVAAKAINPDIKIYGVQSAMYPSFKAQMLGRKTPIAGGASIAEGISVKVPGELTYQIAAPLLEDVLLVDELYIENAITTYASIEKTIAEGAGAAGLAAIMMSPEPFKGKKVGTVLCGGNIDLRLLSSVFTRSLFREDRLFTVKIEINDRPGFLADVAETIGSQGGNIVEVTHNRYNLGMPAKEAELIVLVEARDSSHAKSIRNMLICRGFKLLDR